MRITDTKVGCYVGVWYACSDPIYITADGSAFVSITSAYDFINEGVIISVRTNVTKYGCSGYVDGLFFIIEFQSASKQG